MGQLINQGFRPPVDCQTISLPPPANISSRSAHKVGPANWIAAPSSCRRNPRRDEAPPRDVPAYDRDAHNVRTGVWKEPGEAVTKSTARLRARREKAEEVRTQVMPCRKWPIQPTFDWTGRRFPSSRAVGFWF